MVSPLDQHAQPASRRLLCPICQRAMTACICHWTSPIDHAFDVLILQHPLEVGNAKNSVRLLHLSLPASKLVVGSVFDTDELEALLHGPSRLRNVSPSEKVHPVLLYTDDASTPSTTYFDARTMKVEGQEEFQRIRLVILDGTWRKSRKMLFDNPILQTLPRLVLADTPASRYTIRKSHKPEQLSTLEAVGYALMQLERNSEKYHPLLTAFDNFVLQQGYMRLHGQAVRRGE
ncbi:tRNA-uridine aminocarboxypropyltransferase [Herbaspirillum camelliae]|uniref:tRNA-uridine aminocarboxypropyltransferase n=1 Tax=Herbaspirillum camelliae TaxID=1892903 RepID=UPI000949F36C|nr:tRNA-uridine aminocarboxypropyltransferase [Herbaspirillum camelliae]